MPRPSREERLDYLLDRTEIFDLIRFERLCRDTKDWDGLLGCYIPGSPVLVSWFEGTVEDFVAGSAAKMSTGPGARHWVFPAKLRMQDGRATCESPAYIFDRLTFEGVEFDFMANVRFHSRVLLTDDGWRLNSFDAIYVRDSLLPVNPADTLPVDWDMVNSFRQPFRFIGFCQALHRLVPRE